MADTMEEGSRSGGGVDGEVAEAVGFGGGGGVAVARVLTLRESHDLASGNGIASLRVFEETLSVLGALKVDPIRFASFGVVPEVACIGAELFASAVYSSEYVFLHAEEVIRFCTLGQGLLQGSINRLQLLFVMLRIIIVKLRGGLARGEFG